MRFRRIDLVAALVLAAAACTDLPNEPSPPLPAPPSGAARAALQGGNGKTSLELVEDDYAGGALDKQNANLYREAALSDPSKLPAKYRSTVIGKDATYSLVQMAREWSSLSKSTQDQILDLRAKGLGDLSQTVETPHFVLHRAAFEASPPAGPEPKRQALFAVLDQHQVPVANAVIVTEDDDQAIARMHAKGADAARTAIEMANLLRRLDGFARSASQTGTAIGAAVKQP